jgi:hypothetical protein
MATVSAVTLILTTITLMWWTRCRIPHPLATAETEAEERT